MSLILICQHHYGRGCQEEDCKLKGCQLPAKQEVRRRAYQDRAKAERAEQLRKLQNYENDHPCEFCRDLPRHEIHYDCEWKFGLVIKFKDSVYCPRCDRCLADWS
jgi:hypothetical protein